MLGENAILTNSQQFPEFVNLLDTDISHISPRQ